MPEGTYRLSTTIRIWPGVRVIGYGRTRPVFLFGAATPGFERGPVHLLHFVGSLPGRPGNAGFVFNPAPIARPPIDFDAPARDANPGTFYSGSATLPAKIETAAVARREVVR